MRIGLYGMPTAGKTYIMDQIDFLDVLVGSRLLREHAPDFDKRNKKERELARKEVANICKMRDDFIMDGHYAFGEETAFTGEEGEMYDRYLYIHIDPRYIEKRMKNSAKNQKYLQYDIAAWQRREIEGLRLYCHRNNKDFYILDCPPLNEHVETEEAIQFLKDIVDGYSNIEYARDIVSTILQEAESDIITLVDGDKTLINEDSSRFVFGYMTHLFDGNFYTGFQSWKQYREFDNYEINIPDYIDVHRNEKMPSTMKGNAYILSSGNKNIWTCISEQVGMKSFAGNQMSAETKYFVTKFLRESGKYIIAYGDSMSDYYMLKEADEGYLVLRENGQVSKSLKNIDLGGIEIV